MDKVTQIKLPDFIHCENEPKTGEFLHDQRQFIYCPRYLSLIELIPIDEIQIHYPEKLPYRNFSYYSERYEDEEDWLLVMVQDNIEVVNSITEIERMQSGTEPMTTERLIELAWEYYKNYLVWEDSQI